LFVVSLLLALHDSHNALQSRPPRVQ